MKKASFLLVALVIVVGFTKAQSLTDAIKMLQYGKTKTAKDILQKLIAANNKDASTIYWMGQAFIADDDVKSAKSIYQKSLQEGVNDPYIWIGIAHADLLEGGDLNAAKQKFEQAITASTELKGRNKGKTNAAILNAIGRANCIGRLVSDGSSKYGDPMYAIENLKKAGENELLSPDYFINMGICYRKMGGEFGGEAQKSYTEAIVRDPKSALANYLIGKIYFSQNNKPFMEQYFNAAIAADPSFAPVYLDFYTYYSNRDVNIAKENIEKYLQYADKDCKNDYFFADYLFRAGKYQESLAKAKELENGDCKTRVNILFAYNNDRLNDSVSAKKNIDDFFATAPLDKIENSDYEIAVKVYSRFKGLESTTISYLTKAMDGDTSKENKIVYARQAANLYAKAGNCSEQIKWIQKAIELKGTMSESDHYQITNAAFLCKDYSQTINLAKNYLTSFPAKPQGYDFYVKGAKGIDTGNLTGMLADAMLLQNVFLKTDTEKYKQKIVNNCYSLMSYYNDVKKDYIKALEVCDVILAITPNEPQTLKIRESIKKNADKPATPVAPTKPATPTGKGADASATVLPATVTNPKVTTAKVVPTKPVKAPTKKK